MPNPKVGQKVRLYYPATFEPAHTCEGTVVIADTSDDFDIDTGDDCWSVMGGQQARGEVVVTILEDPSSGDDNHEVGMEALL